MNKKVLFITQSAVIAALYVVLTFVSSAMGLASGAIQVRLSELLTVLPYFTPAAIPGLTIGCLLANLLTGCAGLDICFGTIATLIGAIGAYLLRKYKWLVPIPAILSNALIVPWVLQTAYGVPDSYIYLMATVGIGEIISAGVLGTLTLNLLNRHRSTIFGAQE
ncbi:MAG: QueT transporter family protein [Lachnospiraceae bacterium]|nr:QueT transporter family protein [Lachnospiraceae bacterium]